MVCRKTVCSRTGRKRKNKQTNNKTATKPYNLIDLKHPSDKHSNTRLDARSL